MKWEELTPAEQKVLQNDVCPEGATSEHIAYYLRVCESRKIDPFSNFLYMQLRRNSKTGKYKAGISYTIDGARAVAARNSEYAGNDEPEYDTEEGAHPNWCRATVYRMVGKTRCAFSAKIRWSEFKPQAPNDFQWNAKPWHMLGKTAENQALRKAFPESLGDISDDREPGLVDEPVVTIGAPIRVDPVIAGKWANAIAAFSAFSVDEKAMLAKLSRDVVTQVTEDDLTALREWYEELERDASLAQGAE